MTSNFALVKQLARALGTDEDSTLLVVILITLAASFLLNTFVLLPAFAISYLITFNLCRPSIFIILLVLFYQVGINKLASLEATQVRKYDPPSLSLARVKCRATSVAKNRS